MFNFDKVITGGTLYWLGRDYPEREPDEPDLQSVWDAIYTEYCSLTQNNKALMAYRLASELGILEFKIVLCSALLKVAAKKGMDSLYAQEMRSWGLRFKTLEEAESAVKSLRNQYMRKSEELKAFNTQGVKPQTIVKQQVILERHVGFPIDLHTTSVAKWVTYMENLKEAQKWQAKSSKR